MVWYYTSFNALLEAIGKQLKLLIHNEFQLRMNELHSLREIHKRKMIKKSAGVKIQFHQLDK